MNSTSQPFPQAFLRKMSGLLGTEYPEFLSSLYQPAIAGLRVNTLKLSPLKFLELFTYQLSPVPWCKNGYEIVIPNKLIQPGKHPYHAAGLYYLQEPSTMAAAEALSPQPGENVLDLSAAPGGKSTHIAALMNNQGLLVANEIHPKRVWDLAENLERCGVTNTIITNETPQRLADHFGEYFDRVLVDAPCSGEGMFRKSELARKEWKPEFPMSCAFRQSAILEQAARLVKLGGYLVYTTCTFSPEENEGVVANFLRDHPEFDILPIELKGLQVSYPIWIGLPQEHAVSHAKRIWPHNSRGEGQFIALLVKTQSSNANLMNNMEKRRLPYQKSSKVSEDSIPKNHIYDFAIKNLNLSINIKRVTVFGSYVYYLTESMPELSGLKVIHPGWWIGSIQKDRFIPSHALALGIHAKDAKNILTLHVNDQQLTQYLRGESFSSTGEDGWTMITVDDFPLGWGKRVKNVVKNFYPRGLRRSV